MREPFEVAADAELVATVRARPRRTSPARRPRSAARATGPMPRSSPPPGSRRSCSARAARARTPREEWVSLADTEAVARTLIAVAAERLRVRALVNPRRRPGRGAARRATTRSRSTRALPGYAPTPVRELPGVAAELGLARGRRQGRVGPPRAAGVQGAGRVVGGRARAARAARTSARWWRRAPATTAARSRTSRRARGLALPRLPPRTVAAGAARGDRRRGRGGGRRRRRLRGRGRAAAADGRASRRARDRRRRRRPDRRRWVIDGYATLFAEAAAQARATTCCSCPSAWARWPRPRRASARRPASR